MEKSSYLVKKSKNVRFNKSKKENTLDYYITHKLTRINTRNDTSSNEENNLKINFLKKNLKATEVLPDHMKKPKDTPNNLGYFKTRFGTISVGYNKYKKNTDIVFTLIPETFEKENHIKTKKLEDPNNYLGSEWKANKKHFKASKLSFRYDSDMEEVQKFEDDKDGIPDKEEKLLYEDEKEENQIENLKKLKAWSSETQKNQINNKISMLREIQEEKNEDNLEFIKEVKSFVNNLKKGKLKKMIDSDEAIARSKRVIELSREMNIIFLKRMIERLISEGKFEKNLKEFIDIDLNSLTENQLRKIAKSLNIVS